MSNNYAIQVNLDNNTLNALLQSGQSLCAYKGVYTSIQGGLCPLWFSTNNLSAQVKLSWEEQYIGYVDSVQLAPGVVIDASNNQSMSLGDLLTVTNAGVATVTTSGGSPGDIDIQNGGNKPWTCGMGQKVNGVATPSCAFNLYGSGYSVLMMPYESVLLVFESGQTTTGTVVEETISSSIVITLTGDDVGQTKTVSFDINNGWSANGASWAQISQSSISIAGALILSDPSVSARD